MKFNQPNCPANINYSNGSDNSSDINNNGVETYDVVIIGAGLSGIYKLYALIMQHRTNTQLLFLSPNRSSKPNFGTRTISLCADICA